MRRSNEGGLAKRIAFFYHPLPLCAVAVTFLNDHFLKARFPSEFTGKISDFTGLFYFPLFLSALWVLGFKRPGLTPVIYWVSAISTYSVFALIKCSGLVAETVEQWFSEFFFPIKIVVDPSDLLALLVAPMCYWYVKEKVLSTKSLSGR